MIDPKEAVPIPGAPDWVGCERPQALGPDSGTRYACRKDDQCACWTTGHGATFQVSTHGPAAGRVPVAVVRWVLGLT